MGNTKTWTGKVEGNTCDVRMRTSSPIAQAMRQLRILQWTYNRSRRGLDCKGGGGQAEEE